MNRLESVENNLLDFFCHGLINNFKITEDCLMIMFLENIFASEALWTHIAKMWKWPDFSSKANLPFLKNHWLHFIHQVRKSTLLWIPDNSIEPRIAEINGGTDICREPLKAILRTLLLFLFLIFCKKLIKFIVIGREMPVLAGRLVFIFPTFLYQNFGRSPWAMIDRELDRVGLSTLAQASVIGQASDSFLFRSVHNSHFCLHHNVA